MLPQNYQQKRVMDSMLRNYSVGKHFGLEKTKNALMEVMVKHKITTDPSKLPGYKRDAFLKDVAKSGIGFDAKKAFQEHYSPKPQPANTKDNATQDQLKQASYSEIMEKKKMQDEKIASINSTARKASIWNLIGIKSVKKDSATRDLVKRADNYYEDGAADDYKDTRDTIDRIQS